MQRLNMIIMKKLTSLLIGCSLALAGAALAQQPVEQQSPSKGKHAPEKAHPTQAQPKPNAAKPQAPPATHQGATQQHGATQPAADTELRMSTRLRMSPVQERAKNFSAPGICDCSENEMNQPTHRRPLPGSSALSSGEKG